MKYQILREIKGYRTEEDARNERNPINRSFEAGWDLCIGEYCTEKEAEKNLPETEIEKDGLYWIRTEYYINERDDSFFRIYDTTGGKFEDIGRDYETFKDAYNDAKAAIARAEIQEIQIQRLDGNDEYDGFTRTLKREGTTVTEYDTRHEYFTEWEIERHATCILRGDFLSDTCLAETIANVYADVRLTEEEADEIYDKVVKVVNELLPEEEMLWQPSTSEIFGMSDQEITEDEFTELLNQAFSTID